ncbi:hypothetical protein [Bacillus sp. NPDC094106]|uniref:hypothetical protein n=1 Tax=Bacillus sp. NPDC094106 TaxID=3363949 RepID=UPI0038250C69
MKCRICEVDGASSLSNNCDRCNYELNIGYSEEDIKNVRSGKHKLTDYDYFVSYSYVKGKSQGFDNDHINLFEHPSEKGILWIKEIQTRIKNKYKYDDVKIISFQRFIDYR